MKVLVLGAGGIVGQHMHVTVPYGIDAIFCRRTPGPLWTAFDLDVEGPAVMAFLDDQAPDVIVNLAGENRVDVVERNRLAAVAVNAVIPDLLADWCDRHGAHLIQVSTQGIFDGEHPPYGPDSTPSPITEYGKQKATAESFVRCHQNWTIARLTFVLGTRPFAGVGRHNPLEDMFEAPHQVQANDRWFSPLFAKDAAVGLWRLVHGQPKGATVHLGTPTRVTRYHVAATIIHATFSRVKPKITPVSHEYFEGIAPRPRDTTWDQSARWESSLDEGILDAYLNWRSRNAMDIAHRSREIGLFLGISTEEARARLEQGFGAAHAAVAADFRATGPADDDQLLAWYRDTLAYVWELTAYHLDPGFNYSGMCEGVVNHLANAGCEKILVLGDGIGDLTIALARAGLDPVYNDLANSRTAAFAQFRFGINLAPSETPSLLLTPGWAPDFKGETFDAIVALDFFEHLTEVEEWVRACNDALRPGGLLMAQNAFACGSGDDGTRCSTRSGCSGTGTGDGSRMRKWRRRRDGAVPVGCQRRRAGRALPRRGSSGHVRVPVRGL